MFRPVPSLTGIVKQVDFFAFIQSQLHGPPCSPFDSVGILFQYAKGIDCMSLFSNLLIALQQLKRVEVGGNTFAQLSSSLLEVRIGKQQHLPWEDGRIRPLDDWVVQRIACHNVCPILPPIHLCLWPHPCRGHDHVNWKVASLPLLQSC